LDSANPAHRDHQRLGRPGTLGELLYGDASKAPVSERDWAALVEAIAAGDQRALHALYERTIESCSR